MRFYDAVVRLPKIIAFCGLSMVTDCLADLGKAPKSFGRVAVQEMQMGDALTLSYVTTGCFHSASYELSIKRTDAGVFLTGTDHSRLYDEKTKNWVKDRKVKLKQVRLTDEQILALEKALVFYRNLSSSGCTTVDDLTWTQQRKDKVLARERFRDASCDSYSRSDLLDAARLVALLLPEGA